MKRLTVLGLLALSSTSAFAQAIKPHALGAIQATSKEALGSATLARQLPNGSVIVNDAVKRRLLLLDPSLEGFAVIADSTSGSVNGYGQRPGALVPYIADSTLYLDVTAGSFLVIDPIGKVVRVMSTPRPADNNFFTNTQGGFPGFDAKGRMVYRTNYPRGLNQMKDGSIQPSPAPDSAPIIRVNLDTRKADTVGAVKLSKTIMNTLTMPNGMTMMMGSQAPLQSIDDWSLLSDGSIAIIRGRDYHIDWILPDGSKKSTEKVAFDWKRLTDDDKLAIIDSITKARAAAPAPGAAGGAPQFMSFGDGGGTRMAIGGGGPTMDRQMVLGAASAAAAATAPAPAPASATPPKAGDAVAPKQAGDSKAPAPAAGSNETKNTPAPAAASNTPTAGGPVTFSGDKASVEGGVKSVIGGMPGGMPAPPLPTAADLPDYLPPFNAASARPDADAHLWIRTTTAGSAAGSVVYDVVDNKGEVTDRVEVPRGMTIVGFGRGGAVFLTRRDADGLHLVRASIH